MNDDFDDLDLKPNGDKPAQDESIWDTIKTVGIAVFIAMVVRTFAYEPFSIPSGSMIPTLMVGDYLFVSKASYGYSRHSLPFSMPLMPNRTFEEAPKRGDVAVFKLPTDGRTDYIKRLIGLPGDTIQVKGGVLHINGEAVVRKSLGEFVYKDRYGGYHNTMRYEETLPNGVVHEILEETDSYPKDNTQVYTVPEGHYFAMGDNRDNSQDSRWLNSVGFIPKENLVGRAEVIFFSNDGSFLEFWTWPWSLRFSRFFTGID